MKQGIIVSRYTEGGAIIADKSRADYFRKRREERKQFSVLVDKVKLEALEQKLQQKNKTKTSWLIEKIDEELK